MKRFSCYLSLVAFWVVLGTSPLAWGQKSGSQGASEARNPDQAKDATATDSKSPSAANKENKQNDNKQNDKAKDDKAKQDEPKFVRLVRNEKGEVTALQTAIVRYVPKDPNREGLQVDLVGAVHIGEKPYYEELNNRFEKYDSLLYELVADEGTKIQKGDTSSRHPIGALQNGMKDLLGLEHQLACVDYNKKNFVHADMSPSEFAKSMENRGESIWSMIFDILVASIEQQSKGKNRLNQYEILFALFDKDRANSLKRILAEQFEKMESFTAALNGPKGSTILTERNKTALAVLKKRIEAGDKKLGIYYGAAHLADMEKRLSDDFGLKRSEEQWVTAWSIKPKAPQK